MNQSGKKNGKHRCDLNRMTLLCYLDNIQSEWPFRKNRSKKWAGQRVTFVIKRALSLFFLSWSWCVCLFSFLKGPFRERGLKKGLCPRADKCKEHTISLFPFFLSRHPWAACFLASLGREGVLAVQSSLVPFLVLANHSIASYTSIFPVLPLIILPSLPIYPNDRWCSFTYSCNHFIDNQGEGLLPKGKAIRT